MPRSKPQPPTPLQLHEAKLADYRENVGEITPFAARWLKGIIIAQHVWKRIPKSGHPLSRIAGNFVRNAGIHEALMLLKAGVGNEDYLRDLRALAAMIQANNDGLAEDRQVIIFKQRVEGRLRRQGGDVENVVRTYEDIYHMRNPPGRR